MIYKANACIYDCTGETLLHTWVAMQYASEEYCLECDTSYVGNYVPGEYCGICVECVSTSVGGPAINIDPHDYENGSYIFYGGSPVMYDVTPGNSPYIPVPVLPDINICNIYYNNCNTPVGHMYMNNINTQVRPKTCEFSYDFRNGSLAGFQAAGGYCIESRGSYGIDSGGVYISGGGYDNWFTARVCLPDLNNAKCITLDSCAYYIAGSWSNNKRVMVTDDVCFCNSSNNRLIGQLAFNTASPGTYNSYGIWGFGADKVREYINGGTGEYCSILKIDLTSGAVSWCTCGPTNKLYQYTMSASELNCLKNWKYAGYEKEEGYCYRSERLRCIHYCINY